MTIQIKAARASNVTVALYNVNGRLVQTTYEGNMVQGQARNLSYSAASLAAGMYFLQIRYGHSERIKKLVAEK